MIVTSYVEPSVIEPDMGTLNTSGTIDVLVHWGITQITDSDGNPCYSYQEERLNRQLPAGVRTVGDITAYFESNYNSLLMVCGADVMVTKITDLESAVLDLAGALV